MISCCALVLRVGRVQARMRFLNKEHLFRQMAAPELKEQHVQLEGDWGVERFPYADAFPCNVPKKSETRSATHAPASSNKKQVVK